MTGPSALSRQKSRPARPSGSDTLVMEACAGPHCLARELRALGHDSKPIAPQYVKPFVKGYKNMRRP